MNCLNEIIVLAFRSGNLIMWHCMFRSLVRYALYIINTVHRVGAVN